MDEENDGLRVPISGDRFHGKGVLARSPQAPVSDQIPTGRMTTQVSGINSPPIPKLLEILPVHSRIHNRTPRTMTIRWRFLCCGMLSSIRRQSGPAPAGYASKTRLGSSRLQDLLPV